SFFTARSAAFAGRDSELERNLARKEELVAAAERIDPAGDIEAARAQLRSIQERWDNIGKVPRDRVKGLEARFRTVEDKVRAAATAEWRQADSESEARVAQFRERVEQYEAQAAKARAAGDSRRASTAQAQADQWREWLAAAERAVTNRQTRLEWRAPRGGAKIDPPRRPPTPLPPPAPPPGAPARPLGSPRA